MGNQTLTIGLVEAKDVRADDYVFRGNTGAAINRVFSTDHRYSSEDADAPTLRDVTLKLTRADNTFFVLHKKPDTLVKVAR